MAKKSLDHLIKKHAKTQEEKEELWRIVDEIIHHRIIGCILDNLDQKHHQELIDNVQKNMTTEELIKFLEEKSGKNMSERIRNTITELKSEILQELS